MQRQSRSGLAERVNLSKASLPASSNCKLTIGPMEYEIPRGQNVPEAHSREIQSRRTFELGGRKAYGSLFTPLESREYREQIEILFTHLERASSFLDIGCGFGNMLRLAKETNPQLATYGVEVQELPARFAGDYGTVYRTNALSFKGYDNFDVLYMYRPLVEYRDQLELEELVTSKMRKGATLISLIPAHARLLGGRGQRGVYTKN